MLNKPPLPKERWIRRKAKTEGEKQEEKISPPVFLLRKNPAPSSEGAWDVCITASAVVGIFMQANEKPMSL